MSLHLMHCLPDPAALATWATRHRLLSPDGDYGYAIHALLGAAFADQAPQPFRYFGSPQGLLAYTAQSPAELRDRAGFATPDVAHALGLERLATRTFPAAWNPGQRLGFEVRVRPVIRTNDGRERDAFLHAIEAATVAGAARETAHPAAHPAREAVYSAWLNRQFTAEGAASVLQAGMEAFRLTRVMRRGKTADGRCTQGPFALRSRCRLRGPVTGHRQRGLRAAGRPRYRQASRLRFRDVAAATGSIMLKGRLGLETARMPHADRHGLIWFERGELCVIDGCLHFLTGKDSLTPYILQVPHQSVSMILLGPGSSVTHDALRLLARHGTLLAAVGEDGVRSYTAPPLLPDRSDIARRQAELWGNPRRRISVARHMYALRLGEILPHRDLDTLRGIEGARVKATYRLMAERYGIEWKGRHYDRANPTATDIPNQAINHAATAVEAAAAIAVQSVAAIPQLGFIHEDSGQSFVLDIADLFRDTVTLTIAFTVAKKAETDGNTIDRLVRREAATVFRKRTVIPSMIDSIKKVIRMEEVDGPGSDRDA